MRMPFADPDRDRSSPAAGPPLVSNEFDVEDDAEPALRGDVLQLDVELLHGVGGGGSGPEREQQEEGGEQRPEHALQGSQGVAAARRTWRTRWPRGPH